MLSASWASALGMVAPPPVASLSSGIGIVSAAPTVAPVSPLVASTIGSGE